MAKQDPVERAIHKYSPALRSARLTANLLHFIPGMRLASRVLGFLSRASRLYTSGKQTLRLLRGSKRGGTGKRKEYGKSTEEFNRDLNRTPWQGTPPAPPSPRAPEPVPTPPVPPPKPPEEPPRSPWEVDEQGQHWWRVPKPDLPEGTPWTPPVASETPRAPEPTPGPRVPSPARQEAVEHAQDDGADVSEEKASVPPRAPEPTPRLPESDAPASDWEEQEEQSEDDGEEETPRAPEAASPRAPEPTPGPRAPEAAEVEEKSVEDEEDEEEEREAKPLRMPSAERVTRAPGAKRRAPKTKPTPRAPAPERKRWTGWKSQERDERGRWTGWEKAEGEGSPSGGRRAPGEDGGGAEAESESGTDPDEREDSQLEMAADLKELLAVAKEGLAVLKERFGADADDEDAGGGLADKVTKALEGESAGGAPKGGEGGEKGGGGGMAQLVECLALAYGE